MNKILDEFAKSHQSCDLGESCGPDVLGFHVFRFLIRTKTLPPRPRAVSLKGEMK